MTHDEPVKLEPWDHITYIPDRRKVQNLNAQRRYRQKLKRRFAELEELEGARRSEASTSTKSLPKYEKKASFPDSELQKGSDIARCSSNSSTISSTAPTTLEHPKRGERRHCNVTESPCHLSYCRKRYAATYDNGRDGYWEPLTASLTSRSNSQNLTSLELNDALLEGSCLDELEICPWNVAYNSLLGL
ncbi:hypothetical protein PV11_03477 [Exophiala sideris]|uniref:BZIP domain-containing protein n=1 Tax=Exophiala sideris TaxID=1016849 RepID=A0A0D1VY31_9EURO|nr:hypothetical protein PV11_03477 [Exophiala sideris]